MDPLAARAWLDANGVTMVRVEATGIDGYLMGKHVSRSKFDHCVPNGVALTDFALAVDLAGTPQLGWWAGWRTDALGDMYLRPDLNTLVLEPGSPGLASCLGSFFTVAGEPVPVCPRNLMLAQQAAVEAMGYDIRCAFELEFYIVEERIDEARAKKFMELVPLGGRAGKPVYLTQRSPEFLPLMRDAVERLEAMGIEWEAFNDEAGPGQFELNLAPLPPVAAADALIRAKRVLRDVAYAHGRAVTFMAKPFGDLYGSGLHLHLSLWRDGQPAFADPGLMRHWVGGSLVTSYGATSICTPTINSFRRQVDFAAAPTTPTWGEENKGTAFRTVSRSGSLARVEHRIASADANPYLVLAVVLASGLAGIEEHIDPPSPADHLPWGLPADRPRLPSSVLAAASALGADDRLRKRLGDDFVDHWVESRKWEWLMFHSTGGDPATTTTTEWELARYWEWV